MDGSTHINTTNGALYTASTNSSIRVYSTHSAAALTFYTDASTLPLLTLREINIYLPHLEGVKNYRLNKEPTLSSQSMYLEGILNQS